MATTQTQVMEAAPQTEYVTFFAGGNKGRRPVLKGADMKPTFDKIPLIDFTNINSSSIAERKKLALEVKEAFSKVGFMYAANHGISESLQAETLRVMQEFFSLPSEEKMKTHLNKSPHMRGYEALLETKLDVATRGG
jgi:hypothetical protein